MVSEDVGGDMAGVGGGGQGICSGYDLGEFVSRLGTGTTGSQSRND